MRQSAEFPCNKLKEEPLLERKKAVIEVNKQMRAIGIEQWTQQLKQRYGQRQPAETSRANVQD